MDKLDATIKFQRELKRKPRETEILSEKALIAVEYIITGDFEMYEELSKKQLCKMLETVYKVVHGCNKYHSCYNVHEDWRKLAEENFTKSFEEN